MATCGGGVVGGQNAHAMEDGLFLRAAGEGLGPDRKGARTPWSGGSRPYLTALSA